MSEEKSAPGRPLISVIIPAQNAAQTIGDCLQALQRQTLEPSCYEIVVVDDGSGDGTGRVARRHGAHRILRKERGGYAAAARNLGIEAARGEIACFTDADCVPAPDWLAQITAPLADPETVGVKGVYATDQTEIVARFVQIEYEDKYDRLRGQPRINFIDFYSAAYRHRVLVANGGFDERFPNSEDREFSFRLAARGYKMVFQPGAVVYHLHARSLPDYFVKKVRNGYWTAQVVNRFPTHGVDDSYTPQVLKLQIGLMGLFWLSAAATLLLPWSGLLALTLLVIFKLTTVNFVRKAWGKDRPVALASPFLLAVRATALGVGYAWGVVRPVPGIGDNEAATISGLTYVLKRGLDVAASLVGLLGLGLALPFLALAHAVAGSGPLFRRETRVGQHGERFTLLRLPPGRGAWWPQLWNVLKGEMSLVGPRPDAPATVARYEDRHRRRLSIKPGLVTPTAGDTLSLDERLQYELDYIENHSLRRDLTLLLKTIRSSAN